MVTTIARPYRQTETKAAAAGFGRYDVCPRCENPSAPHCFNRHPQFSGLHPVCKVCGHCARRGEPGRRQRPGRLQQPAQPATARAAALPELNDSRSGQRRGRPVADFPPGPAPSARWPATNIKRGQPVRPSEYGGIQPHKRQFVLLRRAIRRRLPTPAPLCPPPPSPRPSRSTFPSGNTGCK